MYLFGWDRQIVDLTATILFSFFSFTLFLSLLLWAHCVSRQMVDLTVAVVLVSSLLFKSFWTVRLFDFGGCDENTVIKFGPSDSSDGPDLSSAEPIFFYLFSPCFFTYLH